MSREQSTVRTRIVPAASLAGELARVQVFADLAANDLECLGMLELIEAEAGAVVEPVGSVRAAFYVIVSGEADLLKEGQAGEAPQVYPQSTGESFGEMPLLKGVPARFGVVARTRCRLVRFDEEAFWRLMFSCPRVRAAILGNMARRLEWYQASAVQREKLASLGTMAAGLMHELNNPGAAALRAASRLRETLARMHETGLRMRSRPTTGEQMECMDRLQRQAMRRDGCRLMGSLEQADREDALGDWLEGAGVENARSVAPALAEIGLDADKLACMADAFTRQELSDTIHWLESVASGAQLLATIESSIARVTDLVMAVKRYAYEGKTGGPVDVHQSLHSTLIILGHKLREKGLVLRKDFARDLPAIESSAAGLNQVWTNLLDNAIDASPEGGEVEIRTRREGGRIVVSFTDHGPGIREEDRERIFEPFFTTKPPGSGTGLGLDIARRLVELAGGEIEVRSGADGTRFSVSLPLPGETSGRAETLSSNLPTC